MSEAYNVAAILEWCREHRPDVTGDIRQIIDSEPSDLRARGMLFLLTVGFSAGRAFQAKNPDLAPDRVPQ